MFNERDQRCAAVQLMLSTNPSYDNRTIASTHKMQIWMVQRTQGDENKVSGYGYDLWCGFKWGPHRATSHLQSRFESQHQSPKRPGLGFRRSATTLYPSLTGPTLPPTWTHWTTSFGHMSRTSPTWPPATPKPTWLLPSTEYSPSSRWRLWKRHAPSSGSVSRQGLRLKAATLYRCQLYYIIKLPELIFFNKSFKIKL